MSPDTERQRPPEPVDRPEPVDLSIVMPCYNEEESVEPLYEAVTAALAGQPYRYEVILVDDGSKDDTFPRLAAIAARDRRFRIVKFRRNYGQTPALVKGIELARGRVVITMDADLQNDPADIPMLVETLDQGFDLVVGWRKKRRDNFLKRTLPSKIANWLIGKVTGVPIKDNGCTLKAFRAELIKGIPLYSEMHRFIPAMASLAGIRFAELPVRHHERRFGTSKYGLSRIWKVLIDLLTIKVIAASVRRPLTCFAGAASVVGLLALAALLLAALLALRAGGEPVLVLVGLGLLLGSMATFLVVLGMLVTLITRTGTLSLHRFSRLTTGAAPPLRAKETEVSP